MEGEPVERTDSDDGAVEERTGELGRWGAEDQIGCLNFLTNDEVLRGVRTVSRSKLFMLGGPVARPDAIRPLRSWPIRLRAGRLDDLLRAVTNDARIQRCGHWISERSSRKAASLRGANQL
jgi:hypothetical protein